MTSNKDINYCRLCASELPAMCLKNNEQIKNESLDSLILKHLHVQFDNNNILPKKACNQCCTIISNFHNYYIQVQNAQQILESLFQSELSMKVEIKADLEEDLPLDNDNDYTLSDFSFFENDREDVKCEIDESDVISLLKSEKGSQSAVANNTDSNIEWRCYKCEKVYYSRSKLDNHFHNIHNTDTEYMCSECKALFTNFKKFEEHIVEHPQKKQKLRTCEICNKIFSTIHNLKMHRNVHLGIKPFECDSCGKKFRLKQHMQIHRYTVCSKESDDNNINKIVNMTSSNNENDDDDQDEDENESVGTSSKEKKKANWVCCKCKLDFKSAKDLEKHYNLVHDEMDTRNTKRKNSSGRSYECKICGKEFSHSTNLKHHMLIHTGEKKFRCDVCPKKFTLKQQLIAHRLTHNKPNVLRCEYCDKTFKQASGLSVHIKSHSSVKQYECNICHKKFTQEKGLEIHKEWHQKNPEQEQQVICDKCGKILKKIHLGAHMFKHSIKTIFHCDMCPKTYKGYSGLRLHKKSVHSAERPYQCEICNKRFYALGRLTTHKKIHSNDYKFECQYCPKKFVQKDKLKVHMRQHTGERPYSCLECNHHFSNSGNFIKHLKGRHRLKNFSIVNNHQYPFLNDSSIKP